MRHVMFVDDEPNVLDGLRRSLRKYRDDWDMQFVVGGTTAWTVLQNSPVDVLVSDMRMPDMDGAELLEQVKEHHPDTVRILLSGQADREAILRSVGVAHQFLSKPCPPDLLHATIHRACALHDRMRSPQLMRLITNRDSLPVLPESYSELVDELRSAEANLTRIADLISQDVGMTCSLLRVVNSSYFGLRRHIESPTHAVTLLGLRLLKPLVLSAGIFSRFDGQAETLSRAQDLLEHSLAVSEVARKIAQLERPADTELMDHALLAGVVHDVGQLLLAQALPDEYDELTTTAASQNQPLYMAETEALGISHADVGAYLLGLWGFPEPIVEAVAFHHQPEQCRSLEFSPLTAVHVANALVNEVNPQNSNCYDSSINFQYLNELKLLERLPVWRTHAAASMNRGDAA